MEALWVGRPQQAGMGYFMSSCLGLAGKMK